MERDKPRWPYPDDTSVGWMSVDGSTTGTGVYMTCCSDVTREPDDEKKAEVEEAKKIRKDDERMREDWKRKATGKRKNKWVGMR